MAEQITARIARAFRAAREAAFAQQEDPKRNFVAAAFSDVASKAENLPEREAEWSAALAVLLRELAPEPDGELAEAEQAVRSWPAVMYGHDAAHLRRVLAEYDRLRAEVESLRAELEQARWDTERAQAALRGCSGQNDRYSAEVESLREAVAAADTKRQAADQDADALLSALGMLRREIAHALGLPPPHGQRSDPDLIAAVAAAAARDAAAQAVVTAAQAYLAETEGRAVTFREGMTRAALVELVRAHESAPAGEPAEDDDDDGHGPWFYTEYGVLCSCKYPVDADERCTRPRGPAAEWNAKLGALFEAADSLLHARTQGRDHLDTYMDDLQGAVDAVSAAAEPTKLRADSSRSSPTRARMADHPPTHETEDNDHG